MEATVQLLAAETTIWYARTCDRAMSAEAGLYLICSIFCLLSFMGYTRCLSIWSRGYPNESFRIIPMSSRTFNHPGRREVSPKAKELLALEAADATSENGDASTQSFAGINMRYLFCLLRNIISHRQEDARGKLGEKICEVRVGWLHPTATAKERKGSQLIQPSRAHLAVDGKNSGFYVELSLHRIGAAVATVTLLMRRRPWRRCCC